MLLLVEEGLTEANHWQAEQAPRTGFFGSIVYDVTCERPALIQSGPVHQPFCYERPGNQSGHARQPSRHQT